MSEHPLVAAVASGARERGTTLAGLTAFESASGERVCATAAGHTVLVAIDGTTAGFLLWRATMRNIRQDLVFALLYNGIGIPIAAGVLYPAFGLRLSPVIAAAAMALSSLSVVANSNRLRRFTPAILNDAPAAVASHPLVEIGGTTNSEDKEPAVMNTSSALDPVCGMAVDPQNAAATHEHGGIVYYFCSESCHNTFAGEPATFAAVG